MKKAIFKLKDHAGKTYFYVFDYEKKKQFLTKKLKKSDFNYLQN